MSIDVELTLILGLFIIGAVVLAVDNLMDSLYRRLGRWIRSRRLPPSTSQPASSTNYKKL
jgi:hypothetical protein